MIDVIRLLLGALFILRSDRFELHYLVRTGKDLHQLRHRALDGFAHCLYASPPLQLRVEFCPAETIAWERFQGHLLGASATRQVRQFASWNVRLATIPAELEGTTPEPILSLKWDHDDATLFIVRYLLVEGWETYEPTPGVIASRPARQSLAELVATIEKKLGVQAVLDRRDVLVVMPTVMRAAVAAAASTKKLIAGLLGGGEGGSLGGGANAPNPSGSSSGVLGLSRDSNWNTDRRARNIGQPVVGGIRDSGKGGMIYALNIP